ncbi:hypothetical protein [Micromonospora cathayae]|uniref:Uncharacterized protein n=1 Tax=Micromonospora cathayae TaxID=3028804 RepID=A0ABY7ZT85_9ACTN|nr:hypothetical protein [Micromonospora sp. HUAS 3]WDZ86256.1 hypothetical protein PVK37_07570 [Micromonospora sp. HUAS 3]
MRTRMLLVVPLLLAGGTLAGGCTGTDRSGPTPNTMPTSASVPAEPTGYREFPYSLYTHCGVREANIEGRWYEAVQVLTDGDGGPPADWGFLTTQGTMRIISPTEAEFHHPSGPVVTFRLRPQATGPKEICS